MAADTSSTHITPLIYGTEEYKEKLWHARLGHPGQENVMTLMKLGKIPKARYSDPGELCETCIQAKGRRSSFQKSQYRATRPLELVHSDLLGPAPWSLGELFFIIFVDDYTRKLWAHPA